MAVVVSMMASATTAYADDAERLALEWTAPKECPSAAVVRTRALERMPADFAPMHAQGRVERAGGVYRLVLEIDARGDRVLEAATCDALASSAAVVLAMSASPVERTEPTQVVAAPSPAPAEEPDRATPPPTSPRRDVFTLRAQAIGDTALLPHYALGGGIGFGVDPIDHLHVELVTSRFGSQLARSERDSTRGAQIGFMSFDLRGCWGLTPGDELATCLGVDIVHINATGVGVEGDVVYDRSSTTWGPDAGLLVALPLGGPFLLRAGGTVFMPIVRESFEIRDLGRIHRPEAVVFRTFLGPEVRF